MKILSIGTPKKYMPDIFQAADVTYLSNTKSREPDILHDILKPIPKKYHNQFDLVYASHVLQNVPRLKVEKTLENILKPLKVGGELWVLVPSIEWVARSIMADENNPTVLVALYGSQSDKDEYSKMGYTIMLLRELFQGAGLITRKAYTGTYVVNMNGVDYPVGQNIIIGLKGEENGMLQ